MTRWHAFGGLLLLNLAGAQELPPVSGLPHAVALGRIPAEGGWDLVVALSSDQPCEPAPRPCWWNTKDRLAVLLENRADPAMQVPLAIEPGPNDDCSTRVERFTAEELVLSCTGEKSAIYDNRKFVYDVGARKLVGHFSYAPFSAERVLPGPIFAMKAGERRIAVEIDSNTGEPQVTGNAAPGPPQESGAVFGRFHLSRQKSRYGEEYPVIVGEETAYPLAQTKPQPDPTDRNEQIGPHQLAGGLFWFGKTFYNGEGWTGTGGFGYFDPSTASYRIFALPEIAAWSVSAILVEADSVWLALDHRGEYGNYPGGLLRWDRNTQSVRHWDMAHIATGIVRSGNAIYMGLTDGIAVLRGERVVSYFVDRSQAGQYRMAERN